MELYATETLNEMLGVVRSVVLATDQGPLSPHFLLPLDSQLKMTLSWLDLKIEVPPLP